MLQAFKPTHGNPRVWYISTYFHVSSPSRSLFNHLLKLPNDLAQNNMITESVLFIYYSIWEPIPSYVFLEHKYFMPEPVISCSILFTDPKNFAYIPLVITHTQTILRLLSDTLLTYISLRNVNSTVQFLFIGNIPLLYPFSHSSLYWF